MNAPMYEGMCRHTTKPIQNAPENIIAQVRVILQQKISELEGIVRVDKNNHSLKLYSQSLKLIETDFCIID